MPSRPSPGSYPGSVQVPSRVRGGFGPIQVPRWGPSRPVLVPSCSRALLTGSGLDGQKQTSWPLPIINTVFCVQFSQIEFPHAYALLLHPASATKLTFEATWKMPNFFISFFEKKSASHRSGKNHCGDFRSSAPQPLAA